MQTVCHECNRDFDSIESVFRHLRVHKINSQEYVLKWKYDNQVPLCSCGCGGKNKWNVALRDFTKFIHGHHAFGRIKTEEEKRKIGAKNSKNMKEYLRKNPQAAQKKVNAMNAVNQTEEVRNKRKESVNRTYASMTPEDKQKFSDHTKELWEDGILAEAHVKATETYKQRYAAGEYDFTERNDKISATITQRYLDGGFEWSTGQYTSTKTGKVCNYRSSWERELMETLDSDPRIESWRYEPISIPYILDGKTRRYVPDFHVVTADGADILVEVKPPTLSDTVMNSSKRDAAVEFCSRNGWTYVEWSRGQELPNSTPTG